MIKKHLVKSFLLYGTIILLSTLFGFFIPSMIKTSEREQSSFIFLPNANTRITYATIHKIREAWAYSRGEGIKVGILDHSFGTDEYSDYYTQVVDFYHNKSGFNSKNAFHGFFMASTLKEIAPDVKIFGLGTYSEVDDEMVSSMISAIEWAIENDLDILTYSARRISEEKRKEFQPIIDKAHDEGILTVFIHNPDPRNILPSNIEPPINDVENNADFFILKYDYSIYPSWLSEEEIDNGRIYRSISSTAPVAAGIIALMLSANPNIERDKIEQILVKTSHEYEDFSTYIPNAVDAEAAVKYVMNLK